MSIPRSRLALLVALAATLSGCRDTVSPAMDDITATATADGLEIVNTTDRPIYSMEMNEASLALIYFQFCSPQCPVQRPAERRIVPWASIIGYSDEGTDYLVLWAHATVAADGTVQLGPMQTHRVKR